MCNLLDIAWISVALKDYKNFVDLTKDLKIKNNILEFIDLGSDGSHPGPKQHSYYVEKIYNLIKTELDKTIVNATDNNENKKSKVTIRKNNLEKMFQLCQKLF